METAIKGGRLILDFKEEEQIVAPETVLKNGVYYYNAIMDNYGKPITIINFQDGYGDVERHMVTFVTQYMLSEDNIILYYDAGGSTCYMFIYPNGTISVYEV